MSAPPPVPRTTWFGDRALRIEWGNDGSAGVGERVRAAFEGLRKAEIPGVVGLVPAFATLLVEVDPSHPAAAGVASAVADALRRGGAPLPPGRLVEVPVCYDRELGPDLEEVARLCGLSPEEVVRLHASAEYVVRFLGFTPGFPYLSGLPEALATPRLDRPRVRVPAGSVAIAGAQAGIYPQATPGGWRLLGRTTLRLFDASREPPCRLAIGDRVRFVPIARERFEAP